MDTSKPLTHRLCIPKSSIDRIREHFNRTKTRSVQMIGAGGDERTFFLKKGILYARGDDGIVKEVADGATTDFSGSVSLSLKAEVVKKLMAGGMPYDNAVHIAIAFAKKYEE